MYLWNDLGDPVFDGFGLVGFTSRANMLFRSHNLLFLFVCCNFFFVPFMGWLCGVGVLRECYVD